MLFYTYVTNDLEGFRNQLIEAGESPGPITHPFYLPKGEFRLTDPDGYTVMVADHGYLDSVIR